MKKPMLFVSGPPRSGTTLVDKLLWNVPSIDCFSQPLPLLLVALKAAFLRNLSWPEKLCAYPLNDQQFENAYDADAFQGYLQNHAFERDELRAVLEAMRPFTGQYFKPDNFLNVLEYWQGGNLADFARHYFSHYRQKPDKGVRVLGWKEAGAEEFLPYFLSKGMKAILIIRDPRDIAASLYHGKTDAYGGQKRPLLFMVRQWRKSAAYHAKFAAHPDVTLVRYEDLVQDPQAHLDLWQNWLGLEPDAQVTTLQSQSGENWHGNSAFAALEGISTKAIGRHEDVLPADQAAFIEAACFGEMLSLGYAPKITKNAVEAALEVGPGQDYLGREALAHYAYDEERRDEECRRWQHLCAQKNAFDAAQFVFNENYQKLYQIVGTS